MYSIKSQSLKKKFTTSLESRIKNLKLPTFDYTPPAYNGPSYEEVLSNRQEYVSPGKFLFYKNDPFLISAGKKQYVYDHKNERYLDFFAGIVTVSVGHAHPRIVKVANDQFNKIIHSSSIYLSQEMTSFAKELAAKLPKGLHSVFFTNSGGEANELAMLMSRLYTGNSTILSLRNGYHGMGGGCMELTNLNTWKYNIPSRQGIEKVNCPNLYRGSFQVGNKYTEEEACDKYVEDLEQVLRFNTSGQVASIFVEPIQGVGGKVEIPRSYMQKAVPLVRQHKGLWISDEVQTGFGRLGTSYWGFEQYGMVPDIVTMAKGIGGGIPLAAVVTRPEIAEVLKQKLTFNTYGGNQLSSAVGREVIKIIDDEKLQNNCNEIGNKYLLPSLKKLEEKYNFVGEVRGKGLMLGLEFVKNKTTKEPNPEVADRVLLRAKQLKLLLGKGGIYGNTLRITPPMCITKQDAEFAVEVFDIIFQEEANRK